MNVPSLLCSACAVAMLAGCAAKKFPDDDFVAAANRVRPSVVLLTMNVPGDTKKDGPDEEYATGTVVASGSWGSDVLTVEHALEGAWNLHVTIHNTRQVPARIVARNSALDVALIRARAEDLPAAPLGSDADAQPGRMVGLLGYPVPDLFEAQGLRLATSLNSGRISSVREDAIELTAPIAPGESGGPVFLSDTGKIVGIVESRFDQEPSIGFALPVGDAKRFLHRVDAAHGF
jgi:S1-C subfamily serine protease